MRSEYCKCGKKKERRIASLCNACQRIYNRKDYAANKAAYLERGRRNKKKYRDQALVWVLNYLQSHPCKDCGEKDLVVLEFDHRQGEKKDGDVSTMISRMSLERVKAEVAKCDVRCANCHRRKTAKERGWQFRLLAP
jgi:hypothetical protein